MKRDTWCPKYVIAYPPPCLHYRSGENTRNRISPNKIKIQRNTGVPMGGGAGGRVPPPPPDGLQGEKRKRGKKRKERKRKEKEKRKREEKRKERENREKKERKKGRRREKEEKGKRKRKGIKMGKFKKKKTMAVRTRVGGGAVDPRYFENVQFFSWKCSVGLYQILQFYFWKCKSTLMTSSVARTPFTPFAFEILRKLLTHPEKLKQMKIGKYKWYNKFETLRWRELRC